jgi:hypothetical protein
MKRILMMLALAAFLVAALSVSAVSAFAISAADAEEQGCTKDGGTVNCTTVKTPGKSGEAAGDPDPGGTITTEKKTQGNLENDNPGPPKTGTECTGPKGQCDKLE